MLSEDDQLREITLCFDPVAVKHRPASPALAYTCPPPILGLELMASSPSPGRKIASLLAGRYAVTRKLGDLLVQLKNLGVVVLED